MASAVGKIENTSTEEVKQALDASVKANEDVLDTLKSGASEDIVNDHINNARQLIKRVEINRLDVIRTRSAENLKKARQAVREALIKSFDKLRMNGNLLISFVVSLSNHERNRFVQRFLSNSQIDQAEDFLAIALKGFKEMQSAF